MSGPGLNQRDAHHAIHQTAFYEAERLTLLLRRALRTGAQQQALQFAGVLIEHWQTHTLRHAEAEEVGWYREVLAAQPDRQADIIALTRDHDLLRLLLAEVQGILAARGMVSGVVERFEAMLLLNSLHGREEERRLLSSAASDERSEEQPDMAAGAAQRDSVDQRETLTAPMPLAVARPALHAQLVSLLRERGLSSADLLVDLRPTASGQVLLHVAYGHDFAQTAEWPLEADAPAEATEPILCQIAETCERATQADYHAWMHTPT